MADIYLKYKKNRKAYAAMYQELSESSAIESLLCSVLDWTEHVAW